MVNKSDLKEHLKSLRHMTKESSVNLTLIGHVDGKGDGEKKTLYLTSLCSTGSERENKKTSITKNYKG